MNEIEKLYKNAGLSNMWVERYDDKENWHKSYNEMINTMMKLNDWTRQVAINVAKKECKKEFPPFTAEKQIELIKWLGIRFNSDYIAYWHNEIKDVWILRLHDLTECSSEDPYVYEGRNKDFTAALCNLINDLWQDLTEAEKAQIKEILE